MLRVCMYVFIYYWLNMAVSAGADTKIKTGYRKAHDACNINKDISNNISTILYVHFFRSEIQFQTRSK